MTRAEALALLSLAACASGPRADSVAQGSEECGVEATCGPARVVVEAPSVSPEASPVPGARCETAVPLAGSGASTALVAVAPGAAPTGLGCTPLAGAFSAYFVFDLSGAPGPVPVQLAIDAPGPLEAALARGPCGDLRLDQCGAPIYEDGRSRLISATLPPDRYALVVNTATDSAEVHVSASVGELRCTAPPVNDGCAAALPLDSRVPVQSVSGTVACARPDLEVRCAAFAAPDVFYSLDLSGRDGETLLDVDVVAPRDAYVTAALFSAANEGCGESWMCGQQFSTRLPPGRYYVGVSAGTGSPGISRGLPASASAAPGDFALRIGLSQNDCADTPNDTWQTAIDLDPAAELQHVQGNTACGTNQYDASCYDDRGAPDLFYRLDLRDAPGPRSLTVRSLLGVDTVSYLLLADAAGGTPPLAGCHPLLDGYEIYHLAPRLYYFVVDGRVRNAARFELELQLVDAMPGPLPCASYEISACMADSEPACAGSLAHPRCLASAVECGLELGAFEAFCAAAPGCCTGTADASACLDAWGANVSCF